MLWWALMPLMLLLEEGWGSEGEALEMGTWMWKIG